MLGEFMILLALKLPVPYRAGISVRMVTGEPPGNGESHSLGSWNYSDHHSDRIR